MRELRRLSQSQAHGALGRRTGDVRQSARGENMRGTLGPQTENILHRRSHSRNPGERPSRCSNSVHSENVAFAIPHYREDHQCTILQKFYYKEASATLLVLKAVEEFRSHLQKLSQPIEETDSDQPSRSLSIKTDPRSSTNEESDNCDGDSMDGSGESEVLLHVTISEIRAGDSVEKELAKTPEDEHNDDHDGLLKQAYLLADFKEQVPELSLVCVAEDDTIIPLVTSALYHRMVWKIRAPVVGITFCPFLSIVRVVIGWLDKKQEDGIELVKFCT